MASRYQKEVQGLIASMSDAATRAEAGTILRSLIEKIVLTPRKGEKGLTVDLVGDLAGILSIATKSGRLAVESGLSKLQPVNEAELIESAEHGSDDLAVLASMAVVEGGLRLWGGSDADARAHPGGGAATAAAVAGLRACRYAGAALLRSQTNRLAAQRAVVDVSVSEAPRRRFWEQKRPQHLLSGKLVCGACGKPLASVGRDYLACRVAIADGPCSNRARVRRGPLEAAVLVALGSELMQPELVGIHPARATFRCWG